MTTKSPSTLSEALAIFQSQVKSADRTGTAKETRRDKKEIPLLLNVSIQLLKMSLKHFNLQLN